MFAHNTHTHTHTHTHTRGFRRTHSTLKLCRAVSAKFCMLRQQAEKENPDDPYLSLSDFIAPKGKGPRDYIGAFAVGMFGGEAQMEAYAKVRAVAAVMMWVVMRYS